MTHDMNGRRHQHRYEDESMRSRPQFDRGGREGYPDSEYRDAEYRAEYRDGGRYQRGASGQFDDSPGWGSRSSRDDWQDRDDWQRDASRGGGWQRAPWRGEGWQRESWQPEDWQREPWQRDFGSRGQGARDGSYGQRDYGPRDYGSREFGRSRGFDERPLASGRDARYSAGRGMDDSPWDGGRYHRQYDSNPQHYSHERGDWYGRPSGPYGHTYGSEYGGSQFGGGRYDRERLGGRDDYGGGRQQGSFSGSEYGRGSHGNMGGEQRQTYSPKNFTRSDDRVREIVCEMLEDSGIDASDVDVSVKDGEVTLKGTVSGRSVKRQVEDCVCAARGVKECHNQLRTSGSQSSDSGANGGRNVTSTSGSTAAQTSTSSSRAADTRS